MLTVFGVATHMRMNWGFAAPLSQSQFAHSFMFEAASVQCLSGKTWCFRDAE